MAYGPHRLSVIWSACVSFETYIAIFVRLLLMFLLMGIVMTFLGISTQQYLK